VGSGLDRIATLDRCAIEQLADHAGLGVAQCDPRLVGAVVGDQVGEAVRIHVRPLTTPSVLRSGCPGAETQGGDVHIRHVEAVRAEDRHWDHAVAHRFDGVEAAARPDVDRQRGPEGGEKYSRRAVGKPRLEDQLAHVVHFADVLVLFASIAKQQSPHSTEITRVDFEHISGANHESQLIVRVLEEDPFAEDALLVHESCKEGYFPLVVQDRVCESKKQDTVWSAGGLIPGACHESQISRCVLAPDTGGVEEVDATRTLLEKRPESQIP
jgi:hypothetical protein